MGMGVSFNGVELTKWLEVIEGFTPYDGANFTPTLQDDLTGGAQFIKTIVGSKSIDMPFMSKDIRNNYDDLVATLNVSEPKQLIFGAQPDRVYYAIPSGTFKMEEKNFDGKGTITWVVPDGKAHRIVQTKSTFLADEDGQMTAQIVNNGSAWAHVDYEITSTNESGYYAVASQYGAIQIGNVDEADKVAKTKAVVVTRNAGGIFSNWTDGATNYENPNKRVVTTMSSDTQFGGRLGLLPSSFTDTDKRGYYGALKEFIIPTPASYWYLWAQAWFETGKMGQTGAWEISIIDENDHVIAAMVLEKTDKVGNTAMCSFIVGNGSGASIVRKTIRFTPSYWVAQNPYGSESRVAGRNPFDIKKEGNKLTFFWYGGYFSFIEPSLANVKAKKLQFFVGQYTGQPVSKLVTRMSINNLVFMDLKNAYMYDVPNLYPANTNIRIRGEEGHTYVNNMLRLDDEVKGSLYFKIPPGTTEVKLAYSAFGGTPPKATAIVNEVFG